MSMRVMTAQETMVVMFGWIAVLMLLAGAVIVEAAPNIPASEFPGRERERFRESPLDRFTQPNNPPRAPLLLQTPRDCERHVPRRGKHPARKRC
jgi:hypothetical protein